MDCLRAPCFEQDFAYRLQLLPWTCLHCSFEVQTSLTKWQKQIMTTLIVASPEAFCPNNTRKSYSVTEKVRILNNLDATGGWIGRTANAHGIPQSCLRKWNKNRASLEEMA